MIDIRRADERGGGDHGWLNTRHTFSFADYFDPQQMGFRSLRVINEDRVAPNQGFGTHEHDNMEIISYVMAGTLEHKDSMGHGALLHPGEFQRISAGSGITHSEFNPSSTEPVHFYQIWIAPDERNTVPSYEQKQFSDEEKRGRLLPVASPDGRHGSLRIRQNVDIYLSILEDRPIEHELRPDRYAWVQVISGSLAVNGQRLNASDGVAISDESSLIIDGESESEFLLFDLA